MRKLLFALCIVFLFTACDDKSMENDEQANPLIGTWEPTKEDGSYRGAIGIIFTETEMKLYIYDTVEDQKAREGAYFPEESSSGTYTRTDATITVSFPPSQYPPYKSLVQVWAYEFKGGFLWLDRWHGGEMVNGGERFTKTAPPKFRD